MKPESLNVFLKGVKYKIICLGSAAHYEVGLKPPPGEMSLGIYKKLVTAVTAQMKVEARVCNGIETNSSSQEILDKEEVGSVNSEAGPRGR